MPSDSPTRIVLASQSPRRRRLFAWLGLPFDVAEVQTPEDLDSPLAADPAALAALLATEKALAARAEGLGIDSVVLCFDTIVVANGQVLGKPIDVSDAWRMLRSLSGRTHHVVTGCALLCPESDEPVTFSVDTQVRMHDLTDHDIEAWMSMGTYMGCAGAYNIEAQVASVGTDECYQNVAGIPLCHVYAALSGLPCDTCPDITPTSPVSACDQALQRTCVLGPRVIAAARRR